MRVFFLFLIALTVAPLGHAHKYHVSIAEMELNRETKSLEVGLKLTPEDLEKALSQRIQKRVQLGRTDSVDSLITGYLVDSFRVAPPGGEDLELRWVGKEVTHKEAWLFFELPWEGQLQGLTVSNTILFEVAPNQVNTVNIKNGPARMSLSFTKTTPEIMIR